jgi:hypothetical protein
VKILLFANTDWYLYNFRLELAQALRERASQSQEYYPMEELKLDLDADMLATLLGIREVSTHYSTDQPSLSDD